MTVMEASSEGRRAGKKLLLLLACVTALLLPLLLTGCAGDQVRADSQEIMAQFRETGTLPKNWVYLDDEFEDGVSMVNYDSIQLVYIDADQYESHKSYWFDGVDENNPGRGYRPDAPEEVFHIVTVNREDDGSYTIRFYMNGTYYLYLPEEGIEYSSDGSINASSYVDYREDSIVAVYTARKGENERWEIERVLSDIRLAGDESSQPTAEELRDILRDKSWTSNPYDINQSTAIDAAFDGFSAQGLVPTDWVYIGKKETIDDYRDFSVDKVFIYMNAETYEAKKQSWENDVDDAGNHRTTFEDYLAKSYEPIFCKVEISGITRYNEAVSPGNVELKPNTTYYQVFVYANCQYKFDYSDGFHTSNNSDFMWVGSYWCHFEDGQPVFEEEVSDSE